MNGTGVHKSEKLEYRGHFVDGVFDGHGVWTKANGDKYEGHWKKGVMCGQGVFTFADGTVQEGTFEQDLLQGPGSAYFPNGSKYVGGFIEGRPGGRGRFTAANGDYSEGSWVAGKMEGEGTHVTVDGMVYHGHFLHGMKHGSMGKLTRTNGDTYVGEWKHGRITGHGKFSYVDGTTRDGLFENGVLRQGKTVFADGTTFAGSPNGFGTLHEADGTWTQGQWREGILSGPGIRTYPNGSKLIGSFVKGLPDGRACFIPAFSRDEITGTWRAGELAGPVTVLHTNGKSEICECINGVVSLTSAGASVVVHPPEKMRKAIAIPERAEARASGSTPSAPSASSSPNRRSRGKHGRMHKGGAHDVAATPSPNKNLGVPAQASPERSVASLTALLTEIAAVHGLAGHADVERAVEHAGYEMECLERLQERRLAGVKQGTVMLSDASMGDHMARIHKEKKALVRLQRLRMERMVHQVNLAADAELRAQADGSSTASPSSASAALLRSRDRRPAERSHRPIVQVVAKVTESGGRVTPESPKQNRDSRLRLVVDSTSVTVSSVKAGRVVPATPLASAAMSFDFDHVSEASESSFDAIGRHYVDAAIHGFDVCVVGFGPDRTPGPGLFHASPSSNLGDEQSLSTVLRVGAHLFAHKAHSVQVVAMLIDGDSVYDVLGFDPNRGLYVDQDNEEKGVGALVDGLTALKVDSLQELAVCVEKANRGLARRVASPMAAAIGCHLVITLRVSTKATSPSISGGRQPATRKGSITLMDFSMDLPHRDGQPDPLGLVANMLVAGLDRSVTLAGSRSHFGHFGRSACLLPAFIRHLLSRADECAVVCNLDAELESNRAALAATLTYSSYMRRRAFVPLHELVTTSQPYMPDAGGQHVPHAAAAGGHGNDEHGSSDDELQSPSAAAAARPPARVITVPLDSAIPQEPDYDVEDGEEEEEANAYDDAVAARMAAARASRRLANDGASESDEDGADAEVEQVLDHARKYDRAEREQRRRAGQRNGNRWRRPTSRAEGGPPASPTQARNARHHSRTDPANCSATGAGLYEAVVGDQASFSLHARDRTNMRRTSGQDNFKVDISVVRPNRSTSVVPAEIDDLDNGVYSVSYTPALEGVYEISISLHGEPIRGSPYRFHVGLAPVRVRQQNSPPQPAGGREPNLDKRAGARRSQRGPFRRAPDDVAEDASEVDPARPATAAAATTTTTTTTTSVPAPTPLSPARGVPASAPMSPAGSHASTPQRHPSPQQHFHPDAAVDANGFRTRSSVGGVPPGGPPAAASVMHGAPVHMPPPPHAPPPHHMPPGPYFDGHRMSMTGPGGPMHGPPMGFGRPAFM